MGFSVSASAAIVAIGILVSFGMIYSTVVATNEEFGRAKQVSEESLLEQQNTDVEVANVSYDAGNDTLTVLVNNTGASTLSVAAVDLIVDNDYQANFTTKAVEGDTETDLWVPGEQLRMEVTYDSTPSRVRVVTGPGVATTEVI